MELTPSQREILKLLADGLRPSEVSRALTISRTTLQAHIQSIRTTYGTRTYLEAVEAARRRGDL